MDPVPLRTLIEAVKGRWLGPGEPPAIPVLSVGTDSRSIVPGALFVPLPGRRFDGGEFIADALRRGAAASLWAANGRQGVREEGPGKDAESPSAPPPPGSPLIEVDDPLLALERLAAWWRDRTPAETIAITGTVGKTTTKEFLGLLLATRFQTVRARKSFNNRLGVALTLLDAGRGTRFIVTEVGTSAPGELSGLSRLVRPSRVIITEIGHAHLSGLGSLSGVIRAKAEVFQGLRPGGTAFIHEAAPGREELSAAARAAGGGVALFGWERGDFRIAACRRLVRGDVDLPAGETPVGFRFRVRDPHGFEEELTLPLPGRYNVMNALGAIAASRDAGLDWAAIRSGVRELCLPPGRFELAVVSGVTVIDDTYNASRRSALAAIEEAGEIPLRSPRGRRYLVLGDLLELGGMSEEIHREIGRRAALGGSFQALIAVGKESHFAAEAAAEERAGPRGGPPGGPPDRPPEGAPGPRPERGLLVHRLERVEEVADLLEEVLRPDDLVVFKASRAVGLERAVEETRRRLLSRSRTGRRASAPAERSG